MTTPVAVLVRDETLRAAARSQACAIDMVSPYSMESVAAYIEHLEALVDTANISISDCLSTLRYAQETLDAAFPGMDEGAPFEHIVRKVVARHQASDAYAIQLRDMLRRFIKTTPAGGFETPLDRDADALMAKFAWAIGERPDDIDREFATLIAEESDDARTVDFQLDQRTAETLDAERYRYLRSAAGQWSGDECGPMVCSGCGDNFEYLRGEEVDQEVDEAMAEWKAAGSPVPTTLSSLPVQEEK